MSMFCLALLAYESDWKSYIDFQEQESLADVDSFESRICSGIYVPFLWALSVEINIANVC